MINLVFIGVILLVIAYSGIFDAESHKHPLPPGSMIVGQEQPVASTGLSRSFSAIVRLQFSRARSYNPYGLRIFSFFMLQLLMRISVLLIIRYARMDIRHKLIPADIVLSVILFVVLFFPFIRLIAALG